MAGAKESKRRLGSRSTSKNWNLTHNYRIQDTHRSGICTNLKTENTRGVCVCDYTINNTGTRTKKSLSEEILCIYFLNLFIDFNLVLLELN